MKLPRENECSLKLNMEKWDFKKQKWVLSVSLSKFHRSYWKSSLGM